MLHGAERAFVDGAPAELVEAGGEKRVGEGVRLELQANFDYV